jgi:hypothetical protein
MVMNRRNRRFLLASLLDLDAEDLLGLLAIMAFVSVLLVWCASLTGGQ